MWVCVRERMFRNCCQDNFVQWDADHGCLRPMDGFRLCVRTHSHIYLHTLTNKKDRTPKERMTKRSSEESKPAKRDSAAEKAKPQPKWWRKRRLDIILSFGVLSFGSGFNQLLQVLHEVRLCASPTRCARHDGQPPQRRRIKVASRLPPSPTVTRKPMLPTTIFLRLRWQ